MDSDKHRWGRLTGILFSDRFLSANSGGFPVYFSPAPSAPAPSTAHSISRSPALPLPRSPAPASPVVTAVIIGAGHRALTYASFAEANPDKLRIVGMADLIPLRREQTAKRFELPHDRCYESVEQLASVPKFADCAINGTMDHQHVQTTLPMLEAGYDVPARETLRYERRRDVGAG